MSTNNKEQPIKTSLKHYTFVTLQNIRTVSKGNNFLQSVLFGQMISTLYDKIISSEANMIQPNNSTEKLTTTDHLISMEMLCHTDEQERLSKTNQNRQHH